MRLRALAATASRWRLKRKSLFTFEKHAILFFVMITTVVFDNDVLVLLCYKRFGPQKGQHESCRAITRAMLIRSVAIECGLWRSGRTRAARLEVAGDRGERKFKIVDSGRGGKTVPLSHQEPVSGYT